MESQRDSGGSVAAWSPSRDIAKMAEAANGIKVETRGRAAQNLLSQKNVDAAECPGGHAATEEGPDRAAQSQRHCPAPASHRIARIQPALRQSRAYIRCDTIQASGQWNRI